MSLKDDLDQAELVELEHSKSIEAMRSELQILEEIAIPTLVEQHKLVLERNRADAAIQVMRRVDSKQSLE